MRAMIRSMTGFGSSEQQGFKVEVRSLNHRFLDIAVRLPSLLISREVVVRNLVKERFDRGKVDVFISLTEKARPKISINRDLAREMFLAFSSLQQELSLPGSLQIDFFAGYRDVLVTEEPALSEEALDRAVREALSRADEMRQREGETLMEDLLKRLEGMKTTVEEIGSLARDAAPAYYRTLRARLGEIISTPVVDETRLAQEVALLAVKSDITEEITRLRSHLAQFGASLADGGTVGKKLDFLLQEANREVNTIASKSDDVRIRNLTISMKTELEKLREQVQNIQ